MKTIQLDKKCALEKIARQEDSGTMRPLENVCIRKVGLHTVAAASDGKRLVVVRVGPNSDPVDGDILIPHKAFGKVRAAKQTTADKKRAFHALDIIHAEGPELSGSYVKCGDALHQIPDAKVTDKFPPFQSVFPKDDMGQRFRVDLNPKLLYELAEALGDGSSISLFVNRDDNTSPMMVSRWSSSEDRIGVLMPIRCDDGCRTANNASQFIRELNQVQFTPQPPAPIVPLEVKP